MNKIAVGATISGAYEFAFAGFLSVLGTVWFPFAILFIFDAGAVFLIAPDLPREIMHGQFDPSVLFGLRRVQGIVWLLGLVIRSMVTVGLQERALGRAHGPTFFYFSLGVPVWRMIGAMFLAIVALVFLAILTVIVTAIVATAAVKFGAHFGWAIAVIAIIAAICWYIYAAVRLMFFLPAVVVAEEQIGLVRSWELGGGNFWRIVAVIFVVFVPVLIGLGMVWGAVVGPFIPFDLISHFHANMSPDEANRLGTLFVKRLLQEVRLALPFIVVFVIVQNLLFLGLGNGAVGKAYLSVIGKGAD